MSVPNLPQSASLSEVIIAFQMLASEVRDINDRLRDNTTGWADQQTNVTPDRSYDANATSTAELADVLGTLIADLLEIGVLR